MNDRWFHWWFIGCGVLGVILVITVIWAMVSAVNWLNQTGGSC